MSFSNKGVVFSGVSCSPTRSFQSSEEAEVSSRTVDSAPWTFAPTALGERGVAEANIYTHWKLCDEMPKHFDRKVFGIDFGFNNATAVVEIREKDRIFYWDEKLYQSHLTNDELIVKLEKLGITGSDVIVADSAEPARIQAIQDAGYYIEPANKAVKAGIDFVKSHGFYITKRSVNILKEVKTYSWKQKEGNSIDEPVKVNDHAMDAGRYGAYSLLVEHSDALIFI